MLNLDEMYHSYLGGHKQFNIDGVKERIIAYGWHCDGNEVIMLPQKTINCFITETINSLEKRVSL